MYTPRCMTLLFAAAGILACSATGFAQPSYGISVGGAVSTVFRCGERPSPPPTFTATWKITNVQKQKRGLVVTYEATLKAALDTVGRSFNETHSTNWINGGPASIDLVLGSINDPMRGVLITWNSGVKDAAVFHERRALQPPLEKPEQPQRTDPDCPKAPLSPPLPSPSSAEAAVEHLGPETIKGMEAKGTRSKIVIPAQPGTNKPAVTATEESWTSTDYGVVVLRIVKYPDGGYEKSELVSFDNGAPDPMLFEVPIGYEARDVYQDAPQQK